MVDIVYSNLEASRFQLKELKSSKSELLKLIIKSHTL
jgi:hypothetical protein